MAKFYFEVKRIWFEIFLLVILGFIFTWIKPAAEGIQLLIYKILLANAGFLNAHLVRKLAFPKCEWKETNNKELKLLIIALYVVFVYCFAVGG